MTSKKPTPILVYAELKLAIEKNDRPQIKEKMKEFGKVLGAIV
jgi:hypothetical protein